MLEELVDEDLIGDREACFSTKACRLVHVVDELGEGPASVDLELEERLHGRSDLVHPALIKLLAKHLDEHSPSTGDAEGLGRDVLQVLGRVRLKSRVQAKANLLIANDVLGDLHKAVHLLKPMTKGFGVLLHFTGKRRWRRKIASRSMSSRFVHGGLGSRGLG